MIDRQSDRIHHTTSRLRIGTAVVLGCLVLAGTVYAADPATGAAGPGAPGAERAVAESELPTVAELESRVERVNRGWERLSTYYEREVAPVERVLLRYERDEELVARVATALVREAKAAGIEPRLLLAVLLVENPWIDPEIRSSVGAVGLMQVMPVHQGGWKCGYDLEHIDTNVCLGARVFAHYLDRTGGDVERALLRYNGCVTGSNTPNCHLYPSRVFANAGRFSVLGWSSQGSSGQGSSAGSP